MLYLNLSGHSMFFKKRFGTSPEKHCLTATLIALVKQYQILRYTKFDRKEDSSVDHLNMIDD